MVDTLEELKALTRGELARYLESWGFAVYDSEPYDELYEAARQNFHAEGPGYGPGAGG